MKGVPFVFGHFKIFERAVLRHHGGQRDHAGDYGDALAMRAGIGRFVVDRVGDHFQKRLQHVFLRRDQQLVVDRDGGVRRQSLDQPLHGF